MAQPPKIEIAEPTESAVKTAAALLCEGALVAFPTETVYGLGADATSDAAVARLYAAKGRPAHNPLIAHLPDLAAVLRLADWSDAGAAQRRAWLEALAQKFWPGPLTVVLPIAPGALATAATAGLPTAGMRVPAHPVAQALLRAAGRPIVAPSANPSGKLSPTTPEAVAEGLGDRVAMILDGGACTVGVESTIVDLSGARPRLLRPGGVSLEALQGALQEALGEALDAPQAGVTEDARPTAPGQLTSHYAPRAMLRLNAAAPRPGEAWLGFGPDPAEAASAPARDTLSERGDVEEAAARLFSALRRLDAALAATGDGARGIAVAPVPETGLGLAVNDRLRRAAAPRPPD